MRLQGSQGEAEAALLTMLRPEQSDTESCEDRDQEATAIEESKPFEAS